ncbi:MAG: NYN domain-containing protein [Pseudomonadota bacterium]
MPLHRLAVLIDADNASPKIADDLFRAIAKIGEAPIRRIHGDFSGTQLKSWLDILPRFGIEPCQNSASAAGKNATDIALVIDAMDLLHFGDMDGFCLVSSDGDFTRLATRIRQSGLPVFGFGEKAKAPSMFREACTAFIATDRFGKPATKPKPKPTAKVPGPQDAVQWIEKALTTAKPDAEGRVSLSVAGKQLKAAHPGFKPSTYGSATLSRLATATGAFETYTVNTTTYLRRKPLA